MFAVVLFLVGILLILSESPRPGAQLREGVGRPVWLGQRGRPWGRGNAETHRASGVCPRGQLHILVFTPKLG